MIHRKKLNKEEKHAVEYSYKPEKPILEGVIKSSLLMCRLESDFKGNQRKEQGIEPSANLMYPEMEKQSKREQIKNR